MVMGTYTKQNYLFKNGLLYIKTRISFSKITLDAKREIRRESALIMTRAQLKYYFYLWLGRAVDVVRAAGGDVWRSARNPQGPILLPLKPGRAGLGIGAGDGIASLGPSLHRLLHLVRSKARWPGHQFADSGAIIQILYSLY